MWHRLYAALLSAALAVAPALAFAQTSQVRTVLRYQAPAAAAAAAPFALDGTPQTQNVNTATSIVLPGLTTTNANDIIGIAVIVNGSVSSISGGGLTFTRPSGITGSAASGGTTIDFWSAVAAAPLSGTVFTVNLGSNTFATALVFAISGAKTSSTFEGAQEQNNTSVTASITTSSSNVFGFGVDIDTSSTPASGFTDMSAASRANFLQLDYKFSTTGFSSQKFSSNTTQAGSIAIAIVQGP